MLVSRDIIKDLTPVVEGYKIFNNDWTATQNNYDYKDPATGSVVGTVHQVKGEIVRCGRGLHLCEKAIDCPGYYPPVQWNKYAKVRGYGEIAHSAEDSKVAVEILEIVEELTWQQFIDETKGQAVTDDNVIRRNIHSGSHISGGYDIYGGSNIFGGYDIKGAENCCGIADVYFCRDCQGCLNCICCLDYTGKNALFNQKVSQERINEVLHAIEILAAGWFPQFTNAYELYKANGEDWAATPAPMIEDKDRAYAYREMPQQLVDYLKSLPEFDAAIWHKITGRDD